jgi:hypothetical protein
MSVRTKPAEPEHRAREGRSRFLKVRVTPACADRLKAIADRYQTTVSDLTFCLLDDFRRKHGDTPAEELPKIPRPGLGEGQ